MIEYTKQYGKRTYYIQDFNNMLEVAQYLEGQKDLMNYELTKDSRLREEASWYGTSTFKDISDRLKYGDSKITSMYMDKLKQLSNECEDYTGISIDMGAVVSGEPECCLNSGFPETKPHLNIFVDIGYCGGVPANIIANRGVAILNLISSLVSQGYLLDIWIVHYIDSSGSRYFSQRVKLSTEFMTIAQLAFAGKSEYFRVVTWLLTAIQRKEYSYTGSGYSKPSGEVITKLKKEGLYIPSGYTDGRFNSCNLNTAMELVQEIFNDYVKEKELCKL